MSLACVTSSMRTLHSLEALFFTISVLGVRFSASETSDRSTCQVIIVASYNVVYSAWWVAIKDPFTASPGRDFHRVVLASVNQMSQEISGINLITYRISKALQEQDGLSVIRAKLAGWGSLPRRSLEGEPWYCSMLLDTNLLDCSGAHRFDRRNEGGNLDRWCYCLSSTYLFGWEWLGCILRVGQKLNMSSSRSAFTKNRDCASSNSTTDKCIVRGKKLALHFHGRSSSEFSRHRLISLRLLWLLMLHLKHRISDVHHLGYHTSCYCLSSCVSVDHKLQQHIYLPSRRVFLPRKSISFTRGNGQRLPQSDVNFHCHQDNEDIRNTILNLQGKVDESTHR